jgi:serine/threonine protein kinase
MSVATDVEPLLARFIEHHVLHGERLPVAELCAGRSDLAGPLAALVREYLALTVALEPAADGPPGAAQDDGPLPAFEGFQTIERIGSGGMGEVFKLRDLRLNRIVAAKVVRAGGRGWQAPVSRFLDEARALALFSDRRIVQIHECRTDAQPAVIVMEYVDGFELGRIGRSLEYPQRARIVMEVCEAIQHAHALGLTHRDLKPSNIMLDAQLAPRILDFGLSAADPARGHMTGTLPYVAPEQLDRSLSIDARSDVYALGVVLYELLCGRVPFEGDDTTIIARIRAGVPRLPVEVDPTVPEPLQAIALTAMEKDPARRYQSALAMAEDLRRFLDGRTVVGRPSLYASTLGARVRSHLDDIGEWLHLRLIHPHEADTLTHAYRALDAPEDDWILASRALSYSQIALYLGAFLLLCGGLFYFAAARWFENVSGVVRPFAALAVPFIGLNAAAHLLYRREHRAVAVAFYLAAVAFLPLFLLILFHEMRWLLAPAGDAGQLLAAVSNRQLQVTSLVACAWCAWLALRTKTTALSTVFAVLGFVLTLAIASDFGLRAAIEEARWDRVALRLFPLVIGYTALGVTMERAARPWFSRPLYLAAATLFVIVLELFALDGRALQSVQLSLAPWQPGNLSDPRLLDTVAMMTVNGALFYAVASALNRHGTEQIRGAAQLLFAISPFAVLQPLGYLVRTGEYSPRVDWGYAAAALAIMVLSERRQRRAFYYAGLVNLAGALFMIASHRDWFGRPAWAVALIAAGLVALLAGFAVDRLERRRRVVKARP